MRVDNPDVTVSKVYFAGDGEIQVHQSRVTSVPHGFYCKGRGPGRPPKRVAEVLDQQFIGEPSDVDDEALEVDDEQEPVGESPGQITNQKEHPRDPPKQKAGAGRPLSKELQGPVHKPPCRYPLRDRSGRASVKGGR